MNESTMSLAWVDYDLCFIGRWTTTAEDDEAKDKVEEEKKDRWHKDRQKKAWTDKTKEWTNYGNATLPVLTVW